MTKFRLLSFALCVLCSIPVFAHDEEHEHDTTEDSETPDEPVDTSACPDALSVAVTRVDQTDNRMPGGETVILTSSVIPIGESYVNATAGLWPDVAYEWTCDDCDVTGENEFGYLLIDYKSGGQATLGNNESLYLSRAKQKILQPGIQRSHLKTMPHALQTQIPPTKIKSNRMEISFPDLVAVPLNFDVDVSIYLRASWNCTNQFDPYSYGFFELSLSRLVGTNVTDADGDGYESNEDCDDLNDLIHPNAVDEPDTIDQDCDGIADESTTIPEDDHEHDDTEDDHEHDDTEDDHEHDDTEDDHEHDDAEDDHEHDDTEDDHEHDDAEDDHEHDDTDPNHADASVTASGEVCTDDLDNDGDGFADCTDADCFASCHDADEDGMTAAAGDCDDADPLAFLGATEICDDADNDCDGFVDDNLSCADPSSSSSLEADTATSCSLAAKNQKSNQRALTVLFLQILIFSIFRAFDRSLLRKIALR